MPSHLIKISVLTIPKTNKQANNKKKQMTYEIQPCCCPFPEFSSSSKTLQLRLTYLVVQILHVCSLNSTTVLFSHLKWYNSQTVSLIISGLLPLTSTYICSQCHIPHRLQFSWASRSQNKTYPPAHPASMFSISLSLFVFLVCSLVWNAQEEFLYLRNMKLKNVCNPRVLVESGVEWDKGARRNLTVL